MDRDLQTVLEASAKEYQEQEQINLAIALSSSLSNLNLSRRSSDASKLACNRCTYKNKPEKKACDMCGENLRRAQFMGDTFRQNELPLSKAEYDDAVRAQLIAEESMSQFTEEWRMDALSADIFSAIWEDDDDYFSLRRRPSPPGGGGGGGSGERIAMTQIADEARRLAQRQSTSLPSVELRNLVGYDENVHNAAVEGAAFETIAQITAQPLPYGISADQMVEFVIQAISQRPAGLRSAVASTACAELRNEDILAMEHNNHVYKNVLAGVWNVITKHKDTQEMTRRLAEEIADGADMCSGGKIGRLINALRGFVNIGGELVEEGKSQGFQDAFAQRVVNIDLTLEQRRQAANSVLDEYGIQGPARDPWLESINDL